MRQEHVDHRLRGWGLALRAPAVGLHVREELRQGRVDVGGGHWEGHTGKVGHVRQPLAARRVALWVLTTSCCVNLCGYRRRDIHRQTDRRRERERERERDRQTDRQTDRD